jgi:YD repeat-containing protein
VWQFGYDTASPPKLIRVTDPTGAHTDYTWTSFVRADGTTLPLVRAVTDRLGHTRTANGYDSQGRVVTQTYADGGVLMAAYSSASPGENGTTTITDPRGNVTKWDFTWNPMMFGYTGVQVTDPLGRVTQFSRAGSSLLVTSVTDFRNRTTSFEWDHTRGNLLSLTTPSVQANGTSTTVTWAFRYEPTFNQLTEVIDPLGRQVSLTVDSATGNTTSIRDPKGYTTAQNFAKNGDLISLSNALGQVTRFRYTDEGDLQAITDASGNVTLFLLDGASRLVGIRDANGVWDQIQYTPLDLVDSTTRLLSGVPVVTRFQYDAEENLRFLTDSLEQSWEWRYDEKNRPIQEIDPRGASTFSAWDQNDDLVKWRDRKGQVGEFTFGTADRFTGAVFRRKDENAAESSYTVSYDPSTDLVSSIVDSVAGTFTPHFDAVDRLSSEDWLEAGGATTRTLTHTLDELDRRVTLQATGQNPISYLYDQRDDIVSITQDSATTSLEYDGLGRLVKRSLPNGVSTEWGFNAVGDLTSLISRRNGVPFDSHSYTLWPAGNISQEVVNGVTWNFQQDDLYRLTQASAVGGSTYAWEYDLAGNRLSQTVDGKKTVYGYGSRQPADQRERGAAAV